MHKTIATSVALFLASAIGLWGCSKTATPPTNSPASSETEPHDPADHAEGEATNADIVAAFAELPSADRALAEKQKICPVTGELLGSMGTPIKIDVQGRPVFICCEGCKEELLAKPDEYLAKLKN